MFHNLLPRVQGVPPGTRQQTHLQVKELAVASVDDLRAAIAPEHLDDIDLVEETRDRMSPRWWGPILRFVWPHSANIPSWDTITLFLTPSSSATGSKQTDASRAYENFTLVSFQLQTGRCTLETYLLHKTKPPKVFCLLTAAWGATDRVQRKRWERWWGWKLPGGSLCPADWPLLAWLPDLPWTPCLFKGTGVDVWTEQLL